MNDHLNLVHVPEKDISPFHALSFSSGNNTFELCVVIISYSLVTIRKIQDSRFLQRFGDVKTNFDPAILLSLRFIRIEGYLFYMIDEIP